MTRAILIISTLLLFSCRTKQIIQTETTTTERIDTVLVLPPVKYDNVIPIREIIEQPKTIDNERAKVRIQYDTIKQILKVKTFVKPDTVVIEKIKTITTNATNTKTEPLKFSRWKWFAAGCIFMLISSLMLRAYVKTII
jgi:hypothetical protein